MKLVAAFLAGLIVACFAALIYVKGTHPSEAPQASVASAPASNQAATAHSPSEPSVEPPVPADDNQQEEAPATPAKPARHTEAHNEQPHKRPTPPRQPQQPAQIAQNELPPNPTPTPASDPAQETPQPAPAPAQTSQPEQPTSPPAPPPPPPARQPMTVTLASGMAIPIRLGETLSTDHNYSGDTFRAVLDQPIIMNGYVIADKGSKVLGRIVEADKPGRVKGVGQLTLALTEVNTTDGQRVAIQTENWTKQAQNTHTRDAEEIGGGAALGAIIGAIAGGGKGAAIGAGAGGAAGTAVDLGTRGKPAVVPVETHVTFHLQGPVTITEKLN